MISGSNSVKIKNTKFSNPHKKQPGFEQQGVQGA